MAATPATNKGPNGNGDGPNGWAEYRRLVLAELERVSQDAAKAVQQGTAIQLALTQALSDTRSSMLDKIRETAIEQNKDFDRKLEAAEKESERKILALETKNSSDIKAIREAQDAHGKDLAALKAKSALLGAVAGFVVALASLVVGIFIKK
jgi:hypothetical protein